MIFLMNGKNLKTMITVKVINSSSNKLPEYKTTGSSGFDFRANVTDPVTIQPGKIKLISTGLTVAIPEGYEIQVRPRSGMAIMNGITCINTPGTIDADYRGDIGIGLINLSDEPFIVYPGDRIAQGVLVKVEHVEWEPVLMLDETERADGGYGHTGVK